MPKPPKYSFSLIELMVVMAVLAILASLITPSFSRMLIASKGSVCMSNLKALGLAFHNYTSDFNRYPNFRQAASWSNYPTRNLSVFWDDQLGMGYDGRNLTQAQADKDLLGGTEATGAEMYHCPLDEEGLRTAAFPSNLSRWSEARGQTQGSVPRSYAVNVFQSMNNAQESSKQAIAGMVYQSQEDTGFRFLPWSNTPDNIPNPSELIMLGESPNLGYVGAGWSAYLNSPRHQDNAGAAAMFQSRGVSIGSTFANVRYHNNGWNYLMSDGHIENLAPEDTIGKHPDASLQNPRGGLWSLNPND